MVNFETIGERLFGMSTPDSRVEVYKIDNFGISIKFGQKNTIIDHKNNLSHSRSEQYWKQNTISL